MLQSGRGAVNKSPRLARAVRRTHATALVAMKESMKNCRDSAGSLDRGAGPTNLFFMRAGIGTRTGG
jgi:hypothetical protein